MKRMKRENPRDTEASPRPPGDSHEDRKKQQDIGYMKKQIHTMM
jgi:hypothetical protein